MGNAADKDLLTKKAGESPLKEAQNLKFTRSGLPINQAITRRLMTRKTLEKIKKNPNVAPDVATIINPPFSEVDRITDHLYLTGVAGLIEENIFSLNITCIINATYEMPLIRVKGIESYRVPVDDDNNEEIILYFDDTANLIHSVGKKGGRTVVHCMAGASRSSTLVIAYLIKYHGYNLKNAFCYVKSIRSCARPNVGFFSQLIFYEKYYRRDSSVEIVEVTKMGKKIQVPDFYPTMFPELFKAEIAKQLASQQSKPASAKLEINSNKIYFNRKRRYTNIQDDLQQHAEDNSNINNSK